MQKEPSRPLGVLRLRQQGREALTGEAEDPGRERKAAGRGWRGRRRREPEERARAWTRVGLLPTSLWP